MLPRRLWAPAGSALLLAACSHAPVAAPAGGPANAPVAAAGTPQGIVLGDTDRALLERTVAAAPRALRPRLRYALAAGEDGKPRLVVYDGEGLPADGRRPGKKFEYVVFQVVNSSSGEHYDPEQNAVIAAIPPPKERE